MERKYSSPPQPKRKSLDHWLDQRDHGCVPMDAYPSMSSDPSLYYYSDDKETRDAVFYEPDNVYVTSQGDELPVGIEHRTRRYHLDILLRRLIDYCVVHDIRDPISEEPLVHRGMRRALYDFARSMST